MLCLVAVAAVVDVAAEVAKAKTAAVVAVADAAVEVAKAKVAVEVAVADVAVAIPKVTLKAARQVAVAMAKVVAADVIKNSHLVFQIR